MNNIYVVIYRTGGIDRFEWHAVYDDFPILGDAIIKSNEIRHMGYECFITKKEIFLVHGLPKTYEYEHFIYDIE